MDYNKSEIDREVKMLYPQATLPGVMFSAYVEQHLRSIHPERPKPLLEKIAVTEQAGRYHVRVIKTDAQLEDDGKVIVTFGDGYVQRYDAVALEQLSNSAPWQVKNCRV